MITRLMPKFALATVAAVVIYVSTLGLPMPVSCEGVAGAAPSPTCGGDLRECLRLSAKTGIYGARYVTAEDVAKCMEAFNACIHGTLHGNPNPPTTSSTSRGGSGATMPRRFKISGEEFDCTVSGAAVDCTASDPNTTKRISATLSGMTMTGTRTDHFVGPSVNGCISTVDYSWPVTVVFNSDGTGQVQMSQGHYDQTLSGSCSGSFSEPAEVAEGPLTWSPIE